MADLLERASAWLAEQQLKHASRTVQYVRGEDSVYVNAVIGRTLFEVEDAYGVVERTESRDFLIPASDLLLDGSVVLPERGDRIRETQSQKVYVYEVMAPGKELAWRYADSFRRLLRVHTKQVDVETMGEES